MKGKRIGAAREQGEGGEEGAPTWVPHPHQRGAERRKENNLKGVLHLEHPPLLVFVLTGTTKEGGNALAQPKSPLGGSSLPYGDISTLVVMLVRLTLDPVLSTITRMPGPATMHEDEAVALITHIKVMVKGGPVLGCGGLPAQILRSQSKI